MTPAQIKPLHDAHRTLFDSGRTRSAEFRLAQLKKLGEVLKKFEPRILEALHSDMQKPAFEAYASEVGFVYEELRIAQRNLRSWMKPRRAHSPLVLQPCRSSLHPEPLGVVLIIGPWNYPYMLLLSPLIGAIAAGNCSMVLPSADAPATAAVVEDILKEAFTPDFVSVVQGPGAVVGPAIMENFAFNHIFFTGSPRVGKQIMGMAAKHLTPVTLELGGKSPGIVGPSVNLEVAAKRLAWAKFFNAGQTCVAPDYLLVHEDVKAPLIAKMKEYLDDFYGPTPAQSPHLARIINQRRYDLLKGFLKGGNILHGGTYDDARRGIAPTIVDGLPADHPLLQEEIFGPIFPVLTYREREEIVSIVRRHRYPLACYVFTDDSSLSDFVIANVEFGGGCINQGLQHLANSSLPFGGIGQSGLGRYHGKYSFELFSHFKSIVSAATWPDPSLRYPPYTNGKLKLVKMFLD